MVKEMHKKIIKTIGEYKIFEVTRDDYEPKHVGMIIFHTPADKEYLCSNVKEAESVINKMIIFYKNVCFD